MERKVYLKQKNYLCYRNTSKAKFIVVDTMGNELKSYEKKLRKVHRFGFTPKYKEEFSTYLSAKATVMLAVKTFERIGWKVVHVDEETVEAHRRAKRMGVKEWTEGVIISIKHNRVEVKSRSMSYGLWDNGANSKRVKLFIHAFTEAEKALPPESKTALDEIYERKFNLEDYVIPENLSKPGKVRMPSVPVFLCGCVVLSVVLGYVSAQLTINGMYIVSLNELAIAVALIFSSYYLMKISNFSSATKVIGMLACSVAFIQFLDQYFQYMLSGFGYGLEGENFIAYIESKVIQGELETLGFGWPGLLITRILQFIYICFLLLIGFRYTLLHFLLGRVPADVIGFADYHFVRGKSEEEVRVELAAKGWNDPQSQNEVFEALGAMSDMHDLNRKEAR